MSNSRALHFKLRKIENFIELFKLSVFYETTFYFIYNALDIYKDIYDTATTTDENK